MNKNYALIFINIILMSCESTQYQQRSIANISEDEHEQVSFSFSPKQAVSNCNDLQEMVDDMNSLGMEAELTCMVETRSTGWFGLGATSEEVVGEINIEKVKNGCMEGLPAMFLRGREEMNLQGSNVKFHYNSMYLDVCEPATVKPEKRFAKTAKIGGDRKLYFPRYNKISSEKAKEERFYHERNSFITEDSTTNSSDEKTLSSAEKLWLAHVYESLLSHRLVRSEFSGVHSHRQLAGPERTKGVFISRNGNFVRFSTRLNSNEKVFKYLKSIDEFIKLGTIVLLPKSDVVDLSEIHISQQNKCTATQSDVDLIISRLIGPDIDTNLKVFRHSSDGARAVLDVRKIDVKYEVLKSNLIQFKSRLDIIRPFAYDRKEDHELFMTVEIETRLIKDQKSDRFQCHLSIYYSDSEKPNKVYTTVRVNNGSAATFIKRNTHYTVVLEKEFNQISSNLSNRLAKK